MLMLASFRTARALLSGEFSTSCLSKAIAKLNIINVLVPTNYLKSFFVKRLIAGYAFTHTALLC